MRLTQYALAPFRGLTAQAAILWMIGICFLLQVLFPRLAGQGEGIAFPGFDGSDLWAYGSLAPRAVLEQGAWWRLFSPIFLHGGVFHFLMNTFFIVSLGGLTESVFGRGRFLFAFLFTGLIASVVSMTWMGLRGYPTVGSVGASGADCGILGLLFAHVRKGSDAASQHYARQLGFWALIILVIGLMRENIDNAAHIGGFVAGYLLESVLGTAHLEGMNRGLRRNWPRLGAAILLALTLVALAIAGLGAPARGDSLRSGAELLRGIKRLAAIDRRAATGDLSGEEAGKRRQIVLRQTRYAVEDRERFGEDLKALEEIVDGTRPRGATGAVGESVRRKLADVAPDLYPLRSTR